MSIANKLNTATKETEKLEKAFIKSLSVEYNAAYKSMKKEIIKFNLMMGTPKFTQEEMMKYNRLDKLIKNIEEELKVIEKLQTSQINTFFRNGYEINYYHSAYTLETEGQIKLGFSHIPRDQVTKAINNPLTNIALDDNKKVTRQAIR